MSHKLERPQPAKSTRLAQLLVEWYGRTCRDFPWRRTRDPYRIWVSEIMLQQTRAEAVIPYYSRFLERFPTLEALAQAPEQDVLTAWSGLGYYSRARNLRRAAMAIAVSGAFPSTHEDLLAMPGVGEYTAAAIGSIAFDLPRAVLDGNVLRVVARIENDAADIGAPRTRERFRQIAQAWLDPQSPGEFNQALMELGATVCLPRNPLCLLCPVSSLCRAREEGRQSQLPMKLRKMEPVQIESTLLIVRRRGRVLLRQREPEARRMAGFWELPAPENLPAARISREIGSVRHTITHHRYTHAVAEAALAGKAPAGWRWFEAQEMAAVPLSTSAKKALKLAGWL